MLLGQRDAFIVDQAAVLDGIDAGANGVLDRLRAVGVRGDFAPKLVRLLGDGLQFLEGVLRCAWLVPFA